MGSTWDRMYQAAQLISSHSTECADIRTGVTSLMDIPERVRGFEGTQIYTPDDPNYGQQGLAFNVGGRIRISDQVYLPGSPHADSLQRILIHEVAHMIYGLTNSPEDEAAADAWGVECEGSDAWKVFGLLRARREG